MKQKELQKLCNKWQKRLGLEEWEIKIHFCSPWAFSKLGRAGEVTWDLDFMTATIKMLDEKHRTVEVPNTVEMDLVHELVHILLSRCQFDTELDEERAVIKLTRGLLERRR